jgi:hypothetical protein
MTAVTVLERDRNLLLRVSRVIRAAARLEPVASCDEPAPDALSDETQLIACEGGDVAEVLDRAAARSPRAHVIAWSRSTRALIAHAVGDEHLVSLLGWPDYQSMPRAWELGLAVRTILWPDHGPTSLGDMFAGVPVIAELRPRTADDREAVIHEIAQLAVRAGAPERTVARIGEVGHELVWNATYDAPVDARGEPRYAHDRRYPVALDAHEIPQVLVGTDGMLLGIQVTDNFGRLTRSHVLASIERGASDGDDELVDRSYGGAGLGLWRVYSSSAVTIVDVVPGHSTSVTAVFDLDVAARDARTMPPSLHLFDRGRI